ncbi:MAG TPA: low molecular weight protein-tyrosine-phosphatase [Azospirillaceae bacterium]|nr:low molecular weight protein-tyrosine-phosphatase [Azospirillaceae bacterium]
MADLLSDFGVLFVCTGNICRSPTADGVFRHKVAAAGLGSRVLVDGAGTHAYHVGEPPDPRTVACARRRGYDLSPLRARKVRADDFIRFDLVLAMDRGHKGILERLAPTPAARSRIHLFTDFAPAPLRGRDVPDPYYGGEPHFTEVLDMVEAGADALLDEVRRRLG